MVKSQRNAELMVDVVQWLEKNREQCAKVTEQVALAHFDKAYNSKVAPGSFRNIAKKLNVVFKGKHRGTGTRSHDRSHMTIVCISLLVKSIEETCGIERGTIGKANGGLMLLKMLQGKKGADEIVLAYSQFKGDVAAAKAADNVVPVLDDTNGELPLWSQPDTEAGPDSR